MSAPTDWTQCNGRRSRKPSADNSGLRDYGTADRALLLKISDNRQSADLNCMTIARNLSLALAVAAMALPVSLGWAEVSFPVSHPEPITIQILEGKGGAPLAHVHVLFVAGYDDRDLRLGLWSEEAITDAKGQVSLPHALKDFSFVEVVVAKHKLCAAHGRPLAMNLDRVRYEGMSTPNHCGTMVVEDTPGVLTVFTKARAPDLPPPPRPASCRARRHSHPPAAPPAPPAAVAPPVATAPPAALAVPSPANTPLPDPPAPVAGLVAMESTLAGGQFWNLSPVCPAGICQLGKQCDGPGRTLNYAPTFLHLCAVHSDSISTSPSTPVW